MKMAAVKNNTDNRKEKRAQSIAAMGLVNRIGDRFQVSTPSLRGKQIFYEVRRDEKGKIRCNCLEFEENVLTDETFRCEHILAVKLSLLARNTEPAAKRNNEKPKTMSAVAGKKQSNNLNANVSSITKAKKTMNQPSFNEMSFVSAAPSNVMNFPNQVRENFAVNSLSTRENLRDRNKNVTLDYSTDVTKIAEILDQSGANWSHSVRDIKQIGNVVMVIVAVTIDGITREGIGTGLLNSEIGIKKAEQDALTHAAFKFGIARKFYGTEPVKQKSLFPKTDAIEFPANPIARSLGDLVTAKQLGMIRAMSREQKINAEKECQSVMQCRTDELSKKAGSALIQHLQNLQQQTLQSLTLAS